MTVNYWDGHGWYWMMLANEPHMPGSGMSLGECLSPDDLDREIAACINDCKQAHQDNPKEYTGLAAGFYVVREVDEDGNLSERTEVTR